MFINRCVNSFILPIPRFQFDCGRESRKLSANFSHPRLFVLVCVCVCMCLWIYVCPCLRLVFKYTGRSFVRVCRPPVNPASNVMYIAFYIYTYMCGPSWSRRRRKRSREEANEQPVGRRVDNRPMPTDSRWPF